MVFPGGTGLVQAWLQTRPDPINERAASGDVKKFGKLKVAGTSKSPPEKSVTQGNETEIGMAGS